MSYLRLGAPRTLALVNTAPVPLDEGAEAQRGLVTLSKPHSRGVRNGIQGWRMLTVHLLNSPLLGSVGPEGSKPPLLPRGGSSQEVGAARDPLPPEPMRAQHGHLTMCPGEARPGGTAGSLGVRDFQASGLTQAPSRSALTQLFQHPSPSSLLWGRTEHQTQCWGGSGVSWGWLPPRTRASCLGSALAPAPRRKLELNKHALDE